MPGSFHLQSVLRFTLVIACVNSSFLYITEMQSKHGPHFVNDSPANEHLIASNFGYDNNLAMNTYVQVFTRPHVFISLGQ